MKQKLLLRRAATLCAAFTLATAVPLFAEPNPERDAYFGETHVHTSWSLDAFSLGNMLTTPGDAYKYFKGEPIKHPLGFEVKIDTPLDWAGVTDHSEYVGVVNMANDPSSPVSKLPQAQPLILKARTKAEMQRVALYCINTLASGPPVNAIMSPAISRLVYCSYCRRCPPDVELIGCQIAAAYADSLVRNERLTGIKQLKGTSETHPLLSPNDEFANFEIMSVLLGNPPGRIPHIVG